MEPELSIVIPTYNEEECVGPLYQELNVILPSLGIPYEILFIDDGSIDKTFNILKDLHEQDPRIKIIKFRCNFGQSAAMKAGFEHASGKIIITMDADLQNDPHDIPKLINQLHQGNYDVVCGWRKNRHDPQLKKIVSKCANRFRKSLTGELIHDSGCTLRVYTDDSIKNIELYGELHRYIPAMLLWRGYYIGEIVTNHRERFLGKSKYNWKRLGKGFLDLLVIAFWQRYSSRPMHVFGGVGLIMGIAGILTAGYLTFQRLFYNISLVERPLFIVSFFFIVIGVQFIAFGILADICLKIYHGSSDSKTYLIEKVIK